MAEVARWKRRDSEAPRRPRSSTTLWFGEFWIDLKGRGVKAGIHVLVTAVHIKFQSITQSPEIITNFTCSSRYYDRAGATFGINTSRNIILGLSRKQVAHPVELHSNISSTGGSRPKSGCSFSLPFNFLKWILKYTLYIFTTNVE